MNEWQLNRTGPYAEAVAAHQIVFKKFERKSSVFENFQNPASGPTSPNVEIVILVCALSAISWPYLTIHFIGYDSHPSAT